MMLIIEDENSVNKSQCVVLAAFSKQLSLKLGINLDKVVNKDEVTNTSS